WAVQSPDGCKVTPRMRMRLVAGSITARTWAWVPPGRPAVKKSHARIASARRRVDSGVLQNLPHRRRRYLHAQAGQLAVDPAAPPFRVLPGQPQDEGP